MCAYVICLMRIKRALLRDYIFNFDSQRRPLCDILINTYAERLCERARYQVNKNKCIRRGKWRI